MREWTTGDDDIQTENCNRHAWAVSQVKKMLDSLANNLGAGNGSLYDAVIAEVNNARHTDERIENQQATGEIIA